jgi:hypothetical protein
MKFIKFATVFILVLSIACTIKIWSTSSENGYKCESILPEIKTAILDVEKQVDIIIKNNNKELLDQIDYLTRENAALLNEVGDLENQIREFGWLKK